MEELDLERCDYCYNMVEELFDADILQDEHKGKEYCSECMYKLTKGLIEDLESMMSLWR